MKKHVIISTILLATLISCSNKEQIPDAYGNFEAKEIVISAKASGELLSFNIEEGNLLEKGTRVGQIDSTRLSINKEQLFAQNKLIKTKIESINAQININKEQQKTINIEKIRIENLLKDNAIPTKSLDDINGKLNILKTQIESIAIQKKSVFSELEVLNKKIELIDIQISDCNIINPIMGTVLEKYTEQHELIMQGKPLYKIADLSLIELRAYISATQLDDIKLGQEVTVLIDKNKKENHKFNGTVSWISSKAEFTPKIIQTKEERTNLVYAIKILVNNTGEIKIGMPGEVIFKSKKL